MLNVNLKCFESIFVRGVRIILFVERLSIERGEGKCVKIGAKTLRNNFGMKATADEMDVTTKPSFCENENG